MSKLAHSSDDATMNKIAEDFEKAYINDEPPMPMCGPSHDADKVWNGGSGTEEAISAMEFGARVAAAALGERVDLVDVVRDMVYRGVIDSASAPDDYFALVVALTQAESNRTSDAAPERASELDERHIKLYWPVEIDALRREFVRFVEAMSYKLRKNSRKQALVKEDLPALFGRLRAEIDELEQAVAERNSVEVLLEGADVANFAMLVAAIAVRDGVK